MEIHITELSGNALSWAFAKAFGELIEDGGHVYTDNGELFLVDTREGEDKPYCPWMDRSKGIALMTDLNMSIRPYKSKWEARTWIYDGNYLLSNPILGKTSLVAIVRCAIAEHFGNSVDVPDVFSNEDKTKTVNPILRACANRDFKDKATGIEIASDFSGHTLSWLVAKALGELVEDGGYVYVIDHDLMFIDNRFGIERVYQPWADSSLGIQLIEHLEMEVYPSKNGWGARIPDKDAQKFICTLGDDLLMAVTRLAVVEYLGNQMNVPSVFVSAPPLGMG